MYGRPDARHGHSIWMHMNMDAHIDVYMDMDIHRYIIRIYIVRIYIWIYIWIIYTKYTQNVHKVYTKCVCSGAAVSVGWYGLHVGPMDPVYSRQMFYV